jgi:hypothetical protein
MDDKQTTANQFANASDPLMIADRRWRFAAASKIFAEPTSE